MTDAQIAAEAKTFIMSYELQAIDIDGRETCEAFLSRLAARRAFDKACRRATVNEVYLSRTMHLADGRCLSQPLDSRAY
jgi:hypothetical protein